MGLKEVLVGAASASHVDDVGGVGRPSTGQRRDPLYRWGAGVHHEALRTWVRKAEIDQGARPGTANDEAQQIKELEKKVQELRRAG